MFIANLNLARSVYYDCRIVNYDLKYTTNCLWVRPGAYPRVEHLKGASLGLAMALPENIRLGKACQRQTL
jgi:hypothetical protein